MDSLGYTPPGGSRLSLDSERLQLIDVKGAGIPPVMHQSVVTPNRDGATYLGRSIIGPRYLIVDLALSGAGYAQMQALRLAAIESINPKRGLGVIDYTPVTGGVTYEIDGLLETGLGFDTMGDDFREFQELALLSFWCPNPPWREQTLNQIPIGASGGGLSVPISMPFTLAEGGDTTIISNTGQLDTYPVLITTGTFSGLKVTNATTGRMVWFPMLDVASETLTIDMDARTATLGGTNVMPYRSADSESWALARGDNTIEVEVSSGSVELSVEFYTQLIGV